MRLSRGACTAESTRPIEENRFSQSLPGAHAPGANHVCAMVTVFIVADGEHLPRESDVTGLVDARSARRLARLSQQRRCLSLGEMPRAHCLADCGGLTALVT